MHRWDVGSLSPQVVIRLFHGSWKRVFLLELLWHLIKIK